MLDHYGRHITYLRISITDLCNLRCRYCMPEEGVCKKDHREMMTEEEILLAAKAAAILGITKIRITGGEPLVKKNVVSICGSIAALDGVEEVCLTTNGILLPKLARPLREAGVKRLNLSLDTLSEEKYRYITRMGELKDFYKGLDAALSAGFAKIKINVVLIGGFNDDEIEDLAGLTLRYPVDVRFIEMMPMYDSGDFSKDSFLSREVVLHRLKKLEELPSDGSVARRYRLPGAMGNVGLISPISAHFCGTCNRIRLTADGKLKPCLHSQEEVSIRGMCEAEIRSTMEQVILGKPQWHGELDAAHRSKAGRNMNAIGG